MNETEPAEIELTTERVELSKNGDLTQTQDGKRVVVAHYDKASGYLEFATREASVKLYQQVTARLGTVNKGKEVSTNVVRSIGIKGTKRADLSSIPKRPKFGPSGDSADDVVDWYLDHPVNHPEAAIRYRIFQNPDGSFVRRNVQRKSVETIDERDREQDDIEQKKDGAKTWSKGAVRQQGFIDQFDNQIIAGRATYRTFTPQEVRGGFDHEDYEPQGAVREEGDQ